VVAFQTCGNHVFRQMNTRAFVGLVVVLASVASDFNRFGLRENRALFPVIVGNVAGYIDAHGKVVVQPRFQKAFPPAEGYARVIDGIQTRFLDVHTFKMIPGNFEAASDFSEGLAAVKVEGRWGYIDRAGGHNSPAIFGCRRVP
jgi:hypothetical protein